MRVFIKFIYRGRQKARHLLGIKEKGDLAAIIETMIFRNLITEARRK